MSKEAFIYLCSELTLYIKTKDTNCRKTVSIEQKVAVTLYFFSGSSDIRTISNLFGLGRSTVCEIIHSANAIVDNLLHKYIYLEKQRQKKL